MTCSAAHTTSLVESVHKIGCGGSMKERAAALISVLSTLKSSCQGQCHNTLRGGSCQDPWLLAESSATGSPGKGNLPGMNVKVV